MRTGIGLFAVVLLSGCFSSAPTVEGPESESESGSGPAESLSLFDEICGANWSVFDDSGNFVGPTGCGDELIQTHDELLMEGSQQPAIEVVRVVPAPLDNFETFGDLIVDVSDFIRPAFFVDVACEAGVDGCRFSFAVETFDVEGRELIDTFSNIQSVGDGRVQIGPLQAADGAQMMGIGIGAKDLPGDVADHAFFIEPRVIDLDDE